VQGLFRWQRYTEVVFVGNPFKKGNAQTSKTSKKRRLDNEVTRKTVSFVQTPDAQKASKAVLNSRSPRILSNAQNKGSRGKNK
jgi:hypothetical protein